MDLGALEVEFLPCRRSRTRTRDRSTTRTPIGCSQYRRWWYGDDACRPQYLEDGRTRDLLSHTGRRTTRTIARSETMIALGYCYRWWRCDHDRDRSQVHMDTWTALAGRLSRQTWTRTSHHHMRILALDDCCNRRRARDLDDGRTPRRRDCWTGQRHRLVAWCQSRAWF